MEKRDFIQLITQEGGILEMDSSEDLHLVALYQDWRIYQARDQSAIIQKLIERWPSAVPLFSPIMIKKVTGMISIAISPSRYLYLRVNNLNILELSEDDEGKLEAYYFQTNKGLHSFSFSFQWQGLFPVPKLHEKRELGNLKAYRIEDTLLIKGSKEMISFNLCL